MHKRTLPYLHHLSSAPLMMEEIQSLLTEKGALLIKGMNFQSAESFNKWLIGFAGIENLADYTGGTSPRSKKSSHVYNSTAAPRFIKIGLHNEMTYSKNPPHTVIFYCLHAPLKKGQTPLADSLAIYKSMQSADSHFVEEVKRKKMTYHRRLFPKNKMRLAFFLKAIHWENIFKTSHKNIVEKKCAQNGQEFRWEKDHLILKTIVPGIRIHPLLQKPSWFNTAHLFLSDKMVWGAPLSLIIKFFKFISKKSGTYITFGDGSPISNSQKRLAYHIVEKHTQFFNWEDGDLLIIDNLQVAHGRMPFKGEREILVGLLK